jgi:serine/threonine-protein phosphatase 5
MLTNIVSSDGELEQEVDQEKTVTDADREAALECKAKANEAFKRMYRQGLESQQLIVTEKDFTTSISYYSDAIQLNPRDPIFWNNRATAKAKLEEFGGAIADASESNCATENSNGSRQGGRD